MSKKEPSISRIMLGTIGLAGLLTMVAIAPNSLQILELFGLNKKRHKTRSAYAALKRMQRQRIIEIKEKEDKTEIIVTEAGKKRLLSYNFDEMRIKNPKKWDGKWRIVGFDIPEKKKAAREALRGKMRELGFITLQKSFFVHLFDCKKEIEFIGEVFGVRENIVFIEATSLNSKHYENYLKEQFCLL